MQSAKVRCGQSCMECLEDNRQLFFYGMGLVHHHHHHHHHQVEWSSVSINNVGCGKCTTQQNMITVVQ